MDVEMLKRPQAHGLVNAVLRRYSREAATLEQKPPTDPAIHHSHPTWFVDKLRQDWPQQWEAILQAKRANPRRSVRQIVRLLEAAGTVSTSSLSRSAVHRLLQQHGLSRCSGSASEPEERRSFSAEFAGSMWYGDGMHGPRLPHQGAAAQGVPRLAVR